MITAFLYDAEGEDREVQLEGKLPILADQHLLWIDVIGRDEAELDRIGGTLHLDRRSIRRLKENNRSLRLGDYGEYCEFDVVCLGLKIADATVPRVPSSMKLDFVLSKQWIVTVHDEDVAFLSEFRKQERGETLIGNLSPAALSAALLDWHLTMYLDMMTRFQSFVDDLDMRMLSRKPVRADLLGQVVAGRRFVSSLRRMLAPQRTIFYGLSRPDFTMIAQSSAIEHFQSLERRFERTLDAIDHGRELMQGSFDLFNTRLAESTNLLIKRLTFASVMLGVIGALAGIFGMNFDTPYTEAGSTGFWIVVGSLSAFVLVSAVVSRRRGWI